LGFEAEVRSPFCHAAAEDIGGLEAIEVGLHQGKGTIDLNGQMAQQVAVGGQLVLALQQG